MTGNQIKEVPLKDYGTLTNCFVMNFGDNPVTKINVEVLEKLVREALARFVLASVNLDNLSPENLAQYRRFEEDPDSIGYLVA